MYKVDESIKQKRKWLHDYVLTLDPDKEYDKMMSLLSQYEHDEFSSQMLITILNLHVVMPAHGAEAQIFTNKYVRRPNKRTQDTLDFFWTWVGNGSAHPDSIKATQKLNKIHQSVADHLPGHFSIDSDFIYTWCYMIVGQNRLHKKLGLEEVHPKIKKANYNFIKGLSQHFLKENNQPIAALPDSYEACEAYADDWERWEHRYSPVQTDFINALIDQFAVRNFPKPLQFIGRWMLLYATPDHVLRHYRIEPLKGWKRSFTRRMMKTMFTLKIKYAPDPKISFLEKRQRLSSKELSQLDKVSKQRADNAEWVKGGQSSTYITKGASNVSMCPIMRTKKMLGKLSN